VKRVAIENAILNSPFEAPRRHFRFDDDSNFWVPVVNNYGKFGRWAFVEIADPWDCRSQIAGLPGTQDG